MDQNQTDNKQQLLEERVFEWCFNLTERYKETRHGEKILLAITFGPAILAFLVALLFGIDIDNVFVVLAIPFMIVYGVPLLLLMLLAPYYSSLQYLRSKGLPPNAARFFSVCAEVVIVSGFIAFALYTDTGE